MNLKQKFKLKPLKFRSQTPVSLFPVPRSSFPVLRSLFSVPCSPFLVFRSSFTVPRSPFLVLRSPFPVLRSPYSVLHFPFHVLPLHFPFLVLRFSFSVPHFRSPFPLLRSSYFVPRTPFPVLLSPYSVPRTPFLVLRSPFSFPALTLPFLVPRSSIFVGCSPSLVGVASFNCRGHFKQRFLKHLSAMSVLIGKKNHLILRFTLDRKKFQTGLDPSEFTGELLRILSVIRVQQNKQEKENATVFPK